MTAPFLTMVEPSSEDILHLPIVRVAEARSWVTPLVQSSASRRRVTLDVKFWRVVQTRTHLDEVLASGRHLTRTTNRPYRGFPDYQRMRLLLQETFAVSGPAVLMTVGDLEYWRCQYGDPAVAMQTCQLWESDNAELVGFAWPEIAPDGSAVVDLCVGTPFNDLFGHIIAWSESSLRHQMPSGLDKLDVTTTCLERDTDWAALLVDRGWTRTNEFFHWYRVRSLHTPLPNCVCPAGYSLRAVELETDVHQVVAVNNRSRAGPSLTDATFRAMVDSPMYRRELNLVALAADSTVAAFCTVWYDDRNRFGLFEPVGCEPHHRRRGVTQALMTEAMRRLQRLGATYALVASAATNEAANRLYDSLGLEPRNQKWTWRKTLYR